MEALSSHTSTMLTVQERNRCWTLMLLRGLLDVIESVLEHLGGLFLWKFIL